MNCFLFQVLNPQQALSILNWHYVSPYDYYNFDAGYFQENLCYLLDPKNAVFSILNNDGELEGFCSFGLDAQVSGGRYRDEALDIGMGIRPDLTGQGLGKYYALSTAQYGGRHFKAKQLRVTIAAFNQRAQRVWKQIGFKQVEKFVKTDREQKFVVMTQQIESLPPEKAMRIRS